MKQATKHRIKTVLLTLLVAVVFSTVFSVVLFKFKDRSQTRVLFSDLWSYQLSVNRCAIEAEAAAFVAAADFIENQGGMDFEQIRAFPRYTVWRALWDNRFVLGPVILIVFLSFITSRGVVKKSPLSKYKKWAWPSVMLLAVLLVYSIFYGYIMIRERVLLSRFSLTPEKTIVILSGGRSYRVFHGPQSKQEATSITNSWRWYWGESFGFKDCDLFTLSNDEMKTVIDLLKSHRFFTMGSYHGEWGVMDAKHIHITVVEGEEHTTVASQVVCESAEKVHQLYTDLNNIRPEKGYEPKKEGFGQFCLGCGGFHVKGDLDDKTDCSYTIENSGVIITKYLGEGGDVVIPKALKDSREFPVVSIGDDCFRGCTNLTGITIPSGVTNIGNQAFEGCSRLMTLRFLGGVPSIGWGAFDGVHTNAVVYFTKDISGWGSMLGGLPTRPAPNANESLGDK